MDIFHTPVLLKEAIEYLNVKSDQKYIDATLGGGGHSAKIVELGGKVLSIDQDESAIQYVLKNITVGEGLRPSLWDRSSDLSLRKKWIVYKGNFTNIEDITKETGFTEVAGILFDLGVSSHQLEDSRRGFSFESDAELDMRMDRDLAVKASVLVNGLTKKELEKIFTEYGEEKLAWKIAGMIERVRKKGPIVTCRQLAEICTSVYRMVNVHENSKIHPATRVFQALRIVVNDELGSLEKGLVGSFNILKNEGRIVVISFHSLEDRIVKQTFRGWHEEKKGKIVTQDIVRPSEREVEENPRARSAKMRVFEKG